MLCVKKSGFYRSVKLIFVYWDDDYDNDAKERKNREQRTEKTQFQCMQVCTIAMIGDICDKQHDASTVCTDRSNAVL